MCPASVDTSLLTVRQRSPTESAAVLIAREITECRPLPRSTADVYDTHNLVGLVDREEHAVNMRTAAKIEDANGLILVEALGCYSAASRELLERGNRLLEAVEPGRALTRCAFRDPQI